MSELIDKKFDAVMHELGLYDSGFDTEMDHIHDIKIYVKELEAKVAELEKDKERLDYADYHRIDDLEGSLDIRQTIDNAMEEQKESNHDNN